MGKVYVVEAGCIYEGGSIYGVYDNREAAQVHADDIIKNDEWFCDTDYSVVKEMEVQKEFKSQ